MTHTQARPLALALADCSCNTAARTTRWRCYSSRRSAASPLAAPACSVSSPSRRATDKKRGRDGTKYSTFHSSNYLTHHLASISLAAVYTDAVHVEEGVDGLKQRALALAPCASE